MARIPKCLVRSQRLTTSVTPALYTVPSVTKTIVRYIHLMNDQTTAKQVGLFLGAGTDAFINFAMPAHSQVDLAVYVPLEAGDTIEADCESASAVTITIGGDEIVLG